MEHSCNVSRGGICKLTFKPLSCPAVEKLVYNALHSCLALCDRLQRHKVSSR